MIFFLIKEDYGADRPFHFETNAKLTSQKSQSKEDRNPRDAEKEDEVQFDFYLPRKSLFADRTFHLMAAVEPSVEVLKNLIENSGGRYYTSAWSTLIGRG